MRVIAFNGSARRDGNTSALIQEVLGVLNSEGIETEEIHIGKVQGCVACGKCWENQDKHCIIKNDSLNEWLDKMCAADGIILGSPVYCASLSGQMKSFIDRASMVACANKQLFKRKVGAAVVAVRRGGALPAFHDMNSFFNILQMVTVGSTYWNMGYGYEKGEVKKDAEGMLTMRNLGLNMAWLLKSIYAARSSVSEPETQFGLLTNFIRDDLK